MAPPPGDSITVHVLEEIEGDDGWTFRFALDIDDDRSRAIEMRVAWVDYNLWCPSGSARPTDVARAVIGLFLETIPPESLPARLDAARIRRLVADADTQLPLLIRTSPR